MIWCIATFQMSKTLSFLKPLSIFIVQLVENCNLIGEFTV
jgi:hypothetical protein